jgi:peptide/nickel transport system permease protein
MIRLVRDKIAHVVVVLIIVSVGSMLLLELVPGDPAFAILGEAATPESLAALREKLGTDRPLLVRYGDYLGGLFTGDLGSSLSTGQPVVEAIMQRLAVTLELAVLALAMALLISVPAGIVSAWWRGSIADRVVSFITAVLVASPVFLTALALVYFLAVKAGAFPVAGWNPVTDGLGENLKYAFLPALALAISEVGVFTRLVRSDMIGVLNEEYIANAKAKGLPGWYILGRHAMKPASFSLLTLSGLSLGRLMGGAVIVEVLFGIPGIGQLMLQSIQFKDLVMVQGLILVVAVIYVLVNTVIDIGYTFLDPRVRTERVASS